MTRTKYECTMEVLAGSWQTDAAAYAPNGRFMRTH